MSNLTSLKNYEHSPITEVVQTQKGGRNYHHKRRCNCSLCKKRGGGDVDIEMGIPSKQNTNQDKKEEIKFATDKEYDELDALDAAERGESKTLKKGGNRRRKHAKKTVKRKRTRNIFTRKRAKRSGRRRK
jgi:hypothetical protein